MSGQPAPESAQPGRLGRGEGGATLSATLHRCVVVGGAGAVGSMFAAMLAGAGAEVCVVDPSPGPPGLPYEPGDVTAPTSGIRDAVRRADMVLLAVPERVALAAVGPVAAEMRQGALLAHTASVQSRLAVALHACGRRGEAVGLNPMFAPTLGIDGRAVAAVVLADGPRVSQLLGIVSAAGGRVVRLEADEHDRLCAASQALTHAAVLSFGLALAELGLDAGALSLVAAPPHATMLALLARITGGTTDVYWDIQSANPYAATARGALARGLARLLALSDDEAAFGAALRTGREFLGAELEPYRELCAHLFEAASTAALGTSTEET